MEELLEQFEDKPELLHEIEAMWARGMSSQDIADLLSKKSIDADPSQIEELITVAQAKRVEEISNNERIDKDQLKNIAGGWCAFWQSAQGWGDSCDNNFKDTSKYEGKKICFSDSYCDVNAYDYALGSYCAFDEM